LVEDLVEPGGQVILLREVFVLLLGMELVVRKKNGKVKGLGMFQLACKLLYQPSRQKANDPLYQQVSST
jgi:hypothetical protein